VRAVAAARHARAELFGLDLAHPGWSLLLALFAAHLARRPARLARLTEEAQVPGTTALRWLDLFVERGLVRREAEREGQGAVLLSLTGRGAETMEDWFAVLLAEWAQA
jgi:DNA-binding MarR family transcriptional regulator